jgi:hypothetical protein
VVGPGVKHLGATGAVWSDHTDVRPTMLTLLGLNDDYAHDGRALFEVMYDWAVPQTVRAHRETLQRLAETYKQLNACVGQLGLDTLRISTKAIESNTANDATYNDLENQLSGINTQRDAIASQMIGLLDDATFGGHAINEQQAKDLTTQAQSLLDSVNALANA